MIRSMITLIFLLTSTQLSHSASSGGGSSNSGGASYSGSGDGGMTFMDAPNIFERAYQLIDKKKYTEAYKELKSLSPEARDDWNNLLGFTARKSGNLEKASEYYASALEINPKHVGALQYQGELFITFGEIEKAKQNLKRISKICWLFPCNEEQLLEAAISKAASD